NGEWAQATGEEIKMLGRRTFTKTVDVSDCENAQRAVYEAATALGKLDIIVNNAGIGKAQHFLKITKENWERHLQIHLFGTFYCAQAAAQEMAKRNYGRIVNIASIAGLIGPIDLAPYGAAKAGITGLTRAAALDLADYGITVNAIAPGPIDRLGTVEEIAHAALFLASPDSGFITGTVLAVDGGSVAAGSYMVEKYRRRKAGA